MTRTLFVVTIAFHCLSGLSEGLRDQVSKGAKQTPSSESHSASDTSQALADVQAPKQKRPSAEAQKGLRDSIRSLIDSPDQLVREQATRIMDQVRRDKPEMFSKLEQAVNDYTRLRGDFISFYNANIKDKKAEDIGETILSEARKRSKELRDIEGVLAAIVEDQDIASLVEQFRNNPAQFLLDKGERLVEELRKEDPEATKEIEVIIKRYVSQFKEFEKQVNEQLVGKNPKEIAETVRDELKARSASLRQMESRIDGLVTDITGIVRMVEEEIKRKDLPGKLRKAEGEFNKVKDEETQRLKDAGKQIESDFNRILNQIRGK